MVTVLLCRLRSTLARPPRLCEPRHRSVQAPPVVSPPACRVQSRVSLHLSFPSHKSCSPHACMHTQGPSQRCSKPARWSRGRQRQTPRCCLPRSTHVRPKSTTYLLAVLHALQACLYLCCACMLVLMLCVWCACTPAAVFPCMDVPIAADTPAAGESWRQHAQPCRMKWLS